MLCTCAVAQCFTIFPWICPVAVIRDLITVLLRAIEIVVSSLLEFLEKFRDVPSMNIMRP